MNDQENTLKKVAQKGFSGKNFLEVTCYIEIDASNPKYTRLKETIFVEQSINYNRSNRVIMTLSTIDLRGLVYSMKECFKNGSTDFKKYTDPKLAGGSGDKKELSIAKGDKGFYLNMSEGAKKSGYGISDAHILLAMADAFLLMAEETEKALYYYQRNPSLLQKG